VIRRNLVALAVLVFSLAAPAAAQADFGLVPGSTTVSALNSDGTVDTLAGSHPSSFTVHFELKTDAEGRPDGGEMRDVIVDLPPGFFGNPQAMPRCPHQKFEGIAPQCPGDTQVGVLRAVSLPLGEISGPVYNLVPPPGKAAELGFSSASFNSLQYASVRSEEGYGLGFSVPDIPAVTLVSVTEKIWGVPAESINNSERYCQNPIEGDPVKVGCPSSLPQQAYLTLPTSCGTPFEATVNVDSLATPGVFVNQTAKALDAAGNPAPITGCEGVPFQPKISSQPTTKLAENPSGLDFELELPNQGLLSPGNPAETEPRKVVVTLPEGVNVNPSLAEGIATCSEAQYAAEKIDSPAGAGCPEASKLGSVHVLSPLLEEPVEGSLYLAAPYENRFGTLSALYMVARAPERGVLVKQAGKIEFDQATGQITTTFEDLPPIPFSSFKLHFREGARAPLATPQSCGEYKTVAKLTPFSASSDAEAVTREGSFQIEHGADGGACPSAGLPPFRPGLIAGSINNAAGRFSPFNVRLFRTDSEQEFTRFSIKLPPGVTAKLAGIPFCPDSAIEAAKMRTGIHGGQEEIEHPSCPAASEVGHSLVGAGVGQVLAYVPGKLYLAGPYHGSAISLVAITAAKAGPFDLGNVVIRYALRLDPETGEVFIDATGSDPIPHIIKGVPVHARDIRAYTDRPDFVLNPTSCKRTSTASTLLGSGLDFSSEADDRPVTVSTPYQAADCAALPFKPRLSLKLKGGTNRGSYPALKANLVMNGIGEAGVKKAEVILPRSEFIANAHFQTICTRVQFKQLGGNGEACPPGSIYGYAKAITPLLSTPLEGPIFLRSNGNERKLPDVVASLHNGEIDVHLVGFVDSVKGRLRNTFESTPDAPVSSVAINLFGGKKGLFENSTDLCAHTHKVEANFTGQNGKLAELRPVLKPLGCKGSARKGKKSKKRKG
jgi:hypothetical protein